jgi:Fe-S-cluster containining protein
VRRVVKMTGADPEEFLEFLTPEEVEDVADDDPTWLNVTKDRYIMALRRDQEGCNFLNKKTRLCTIYEARPILCRLYPFKLDQTRVGKFKGFSLHRDVGCPKHKDGTISTKPLYDLNVQDELNQEDYSELVELFNEKEYEGKEPEDFVVMFMHGLKNFDEYLAS